MRNTIRPIYTLFIELIQSFDHRLAAWQLMQSVTSATVIAFEPLIGRHDMRYRTSPTYVARCTKYTGGRTSYLLQLKKLTFYGDVRKAALLSPKFIIHAFSSVV